MSESTSNAASPTTSPHRLVGRTQQCPANNTRCSKADTTSRGKALAADTTGGYRSAPPARTGPGTSLYRSDDLRLPDLR